MRRWPEPCLMLISDRTRLRGRKLEEVVALAVEGGVNAVQLREKDLPTAGLYDMAMTLRYVLRGQALFLLNDRVDVALAAGADGVHLPERSLPGKAVREIAGESCLIGRSVHSVEAALHAETDAADYVVAGPVFATASHPGQPPAGIELIRAVAEATRVPVIAIGGISESNVRDVIAAGAEGVAVISAIWDAADPKEAALSLREALNAAYSG
jgi:thiamine-phosphate diphosphorylase